MIPLNVYPANSVVPICFPSYGKTNGESITLTGLAVTDIEIYKGTSMTQRASDAGYTLIDTDGIDIDGLVGIHGFSIDLSDNTDAGFYAVGSFYTVVVASVTVDSQTVNFIADRFRIAPAESVTGTPKADVSHVAGTAQTAGDIIGDTNDIQARLPAALTAGGNIKADALAWAGGATDTADIALKATLAKGTDLTGFNDLSAAQVNTEVDTALADARLDELLAADSDIDGAAPPTVGSVFHELLTKTAGSFTYDQTTDSLEAVRDRGDASWITATGFSTHSAADVWAAGTRTLTSFGSLVSDMWANGTRTLTGFSTALAVAVWDVLESAIATASSIGIKAKTNLDATVSSRLAAAGYTAPDNAGITTIIGYLDTEIAAIQAALADGTSGLSALNTDLDALLARLSALRAGYLDYLSVGPVALEATLTAMKGAGWTTETLKAIKDAQQVVAIKRNQALNNFTFTMVDSSGNLLPNLTVTATRRLDGGTFAACANAVVGISGGLYEINLANTDVNAVVATLKFTASGAKTRYITLLTQP